MPAPPVQPKFEPVSTVAPAAPLSDAAFVHERLAVSPPFDGAYNSASVTHLAGLGRFRADEIPSFRGDVHSAPVSRRCSHAGISPSQHRAGLRQPSSAATAVGPSAVLHSPWGRTAFIPPMIAPVMRENMCKLGHAINAGTCVQENQMSVDTPCFAACDAICITLHSPHPGTPSSRFFR